MSNKFLASLLLAVFSFSSGLLGQAVSGNIVGTARDASGAALPSATITITDLQRGSVYQAHTSEDGNFSQTHLLAGKYSVKVESPGLGAFSATADVQVDATTRLDATLQPSNVTTTV